MKKIPLEELILRSHEIHKNDDGTPKYSYEKITECNGTKDKVTITCPVHGDFTTTFAKHIYRQHGCDACGRIKMWDSRGRTDTESFIKEAKEIHKDSDGNPLYDYSKVDYKASRLPVIITCPIHGDFPKTPNKHVNLRQGCPFCSRGLDAKEEMLYADLVNAFGKENIIRQYRFKELGAKSLDFYLPEKKVAVEYQGLQHFRSVEHFGGEEALKGTVQRDKDKLKICNENWIKLLYFTYTRADVPDDYFAKVFTSIDELINEIG